MNKVRLGVVAALVAATVAPAVAHAGTFCRPDVRPEGWTTVAGHEVPTSVGYYGTICF